MTGYSSLLCLPSELDGYTEFGAGERHGSYEKTWSREDEGGLLRFLSVSVTPSPPVSPPTGSTPADTYSVEVWAGASNGERFTRRRVARWGHLTAQLLKQPEATFAAELQSAKQQAAAQAEALQPWELTESYPVLRGRQNR